MLGSSSCYESSMGHIFEDAGSDSKDDKGHRLMKGRQWENPVGYVSEDAGSDSVVDGGCCRAKGW
ncbi:hypothetical protein PanWU01x14_103210, partial [Parasponia andersonii]